MAQGRNRGGATPAVHPLTKDISLNRGAFYTFYNGLMPYIISSFLLLIYLRPPLKITQLRPGDARGANSFCLFWQFARGVQYEWTYFTRRRRTELRPWMMDGQVYLAVGVD